MGLQSLMSFTLSPFVTLWDQIKGKGWERLADATRNHLFKSPRSSFHSANRLRLGRHRERETMFQRWLDAGPYPSTCSKSRKGYNWYPHDGEQCGNCNGRSLSSLNMPHWESWTLWGTGQCLTTSCLREKVHANCHGVNNSTVTNFKLATWHHRTES